MMCGLEKQLRNMLTFSVSVNVLLCLWLAPIMGAQGAAIATAAALILQNVLAAFVVWKRLGFMSVPFLPACQNPRSC
jgi:O-antigen/teichoic acid export membrane protein